MVCREWWQVPNTNGPFQLQSAPDESFQGLAVRHQNNAGVSAAPEAQKKEVLH